MKSLVSLTLVAGLLATPHLQAKEIAGIDLPAQVQVADTQLTLNGAGVRSKFFMDLYVGSLYVMAPANDLSAISSQPQVMITLDITSSLISADKMKDAINEGFDLATAGNTEALATRITQFMSLFRDTIVPGDKFSLMVTKGEGVSCYKNGQLLATIHGDDFGQALLAIWLGDEPAQDSLKDAMLGE
ncbi:chalcone isomerase family protein [Shewanella sp. NIFS-20-20]|uniref:chalcone isomerase family protein n=1 Tax=Shewanella sp. NIFS-20-20 TaxID=2853806 RepID=UPI001C44D722|nr:chalcone isomerase family protein [Shewanella sp. NIFS-20-20]MBV7316399.1 chalcone isomerase family protein [Shewanella sp. NIFS-20-20]